MTYKKPHISVKAILLFLIILCVLSTGINFYLHKNYKESFSKAKDESYIEDGMSGLKTSKDKKYSYRINEEGNAVEIISYLVSDAENLEVPEKNRRINGDFFGRGFFCIS